MVPIAVKTALMPALLGALIAPSGALAGASAPAPYISCHADREFSCDLKGCTETPGDSYYVTVTYDFETTTGDLCTFTYCRAFTLYRLPGADAGLGVTRSEDSGSTEDMRGKPVLDYLLSISGDRQRFTLFNAGGDGAGGWSGPCDAQ